MSLSQDNIDKLCKNGVYKCEVTKSWLPSYKRDTPYHCVNWIFVPYYYEESNIYVMRDTYWSTGDGLSVTLTDENFDKFELLFDHTKVHKVMPPDWYDYAEEDRFHVAMDSGGWQYSRGYFVKKDARKDPDLWLSRLQSELASLESQVKWKEDEIKGAIKTIAEYEPQDDMREDFKKDMIRKFMNNQQDLQ